MLAAGGAVTAHIRVGADAGGVAKPLPGSCTAAAIDRGGTEDTAWVIWSMDDAVSIKVLWEPDGGRRLVLSQSLAWILFQAMWGNAEGEEPLLSHKNIKDLSPQQGVLGLDL